MTNKEKIEGMLQVLENPSCDTEQKLKGVLENTLSLPDDSQYRILAFLKKWLGNNDKTRI